MSKWPGGSTLEAAREIIFHGFELSSRSESFNKDLKGWKVIINSRKTFNQEKWKCQCQGQGKICKEINSKGWKVFITFLGWQSVHRHHHHHHGHHYCHHHRHHYRHHHLIIGNRWWGIVTSPTLVTWVDWHYVNNYDKKNDDYMRPMISLMLTVEVMLMLMFFCWNLRDMNTRKTLLLRWGTRSSDHIWWFWLKTITMTMMMMTMMITSTMTNVVKMLMLAFHNCPICTSWSGAQKRPEKENDFIGDNMKGT